MPSPSKQTGGVLARDRIHDSEPPAASMARFAVDASEGPARAREVFQDEGVVVLKGVVPPAVCGATHDFLAGALDGMADLFARYDVATDTPDCALSCE